MALEFPLSTADFMDLLPVRVMTFDLPEAVEMTETAGGEILVADFGSRLWQGEVELDDMTPDEADTVMPRLDVLRRGDASFMVYDLRRPGPRNPLPGQVKGTIQNILANRREMSLSGFPPKWSISPHDYVAFSYGADPVRHALHRVVTQGTAGAAGNVSRFEVSPPIRVGATVGAAVRLVRAACKAIIVPGSVNAGKVRHRMVTGVTFRFIQTLR